jgi:ubiquinol-cytochrome c reductase iron-sulfur subunit
MADKEFDRKKRRFLLLTTTVASGVAAGAAGVPFVASMMPSERARAAGAPVEVDLSGLEPGQMMVVEWRGKPVWILHRTPEMLKAIEADEGRVADPASRRSEQPDFARNPFRALKPEFLVLVGICTHLGCSPVQRLAAQAEPFAADWRGGFYCPCHGSLFDLSGRVWRNMPAPDNLTVPPYSFITDTHLIIGEETRGA